MQTLNHPLVIVGAGVAGLYTAWRILLDTPEQHVLIVDRLNRTGGRLDSDLVNIPTAQGEATVRDEEGGMRFNYGMTELMSVFGALDLCDEIVDFPMSDPRNRFFLRGRGFTVAEAEQGGNAIWGEIYQLLPGERNLSPAAIMQQALQTVLDANNAGPLPQPTTPEFWARVRLEMSWNKVLLKDWQLWGLMQALGYSAECITMLSHTIGFEAPFRDVINAGEAFQLLDDFPVDPLYFTFRAGFSALPDALVKKLAAYPNCELHLGTNVDRLTGAEGAFTLELTTAPAGESYRPGRGVSSVVNCGTVVLAIAGAGMEKLYQRSPALYANDREETLLNDIRSIVNLRLLKINLYYDQPWWEAGDNPLSKNRFGPNFTDLALNSAYPFYSINSDKRTSAAAITIYCDYSNTSFWEGMQNVGPKFDSPLQRAHEVAPVVLFPASEAAVAEATRQLGQLYNRNDIPRPLMTSYRLWGGEDDFGYAYHLWGIGTDDAAVRRRMTQPVPGVYTCNEAWSDMQGWVNGSLRSANLVLDALRVKPLDSTACTTT